MSVRINRLTTADKLNHEMRSLMSRLNKTTAKREHYVTFDAINRKNFDTLHRKIEDTNIQLQTSIDNIEITSNRRRRSSRKKRTYIQRLIDDAEKKRDLLIEKLKKYRQNALEIEKVMANTYRHLTEEKRIAKQINITQLKFQKLTTTSRGMGKKTKNRRIKKNQTKTKRRKPTRRRKKPKKKKN